jgi:hypothetical protein
MDFKTSGIPALDFIIDQILKTNFKVYSNDLVEAGYIKDEPDAEHEFERLLAIIAPIGCAKVNPRTNEDNGANVETNELTAKFKLDGGFNKEFKTQLKDSFIKISKYIVSIIVFIVAVFALLVNYDKLTTNGILPLKEPTYLQANKSKIDSTSIEIFLQDDSLTQKNIKQNQDTLIKDTLNK